MITNEQIQLFRSLFKGREDVFAMQWTSRKQIGYMPAYSYDPYMYRLHKRNGGTFKNDKGKLIQYIGRVQRSELTPIIYDYRDIKIPYLNRIFLKRNTYYRHLDREATLFDDLDEFQNTTKDSVKIEKTIRISIEQLNFHFIKLFMLFLT